MRIVYNDWIPFKGYAAINLFGVLFIQRGAVVTERMLNHERIHTEQMKEMLYVFFYLWYVVEWFIEIFRYGNTAYHTNTFERECKANEDNLAYLDSREHFAWLEYI